MPHVLADRISALASGRSGVTFAKVKSLEGRMPALTPGISGILALQIVGDVLAVMTDNLAAQFNIYREFIAPDPEEPADPPIDTAKLAAEANVSLLELLIGFEPVEELLAPAVTVRDHMCVPGDDTARSGDALIATYRHIVQEFNLFFGSNIIQAAIDLGTKLAPEFDELMDAVFPIYRDSTAKLFEEDGLAQSIISGKVFVLASLVLIFGGTGQTFVKRNEKLPGGLADDLVLVMFSSLTTGVPITLDITLKKADGTIVVVNIVHPGDDGVELALDAPNKYVSVELMKKVSGGSDLDSLIVIRKRVRGLPT